VERGGEWSGVRFSRVRGVPWGGGGEGSRRSGRLPTREGGACPSFRIVVYTRKREKCEFGGEEGAAEVDEEERREERKEEERRLLPVLFRCCGKLTFRGSQNGLLACLRRVL